MPSAHGRSRPRHRPRCRRTASPARRCHRTGRGSDSSRNRRRIPGQRSQRASDRLARLRLGLACDAARVDHVQLGLGLWNLGVARREQRFPRQHRIGLRHLATEELDRERRHLGATVACSPRRRRQRINPLATGVPSYFSIIGLTDVLDSVRSERGESSIWDPNRGLGRGATTSRSRPPRVTPIASGLGNWESPP